MPCHYKYIQYLEPPTLNHRVYLCTCPFTLNSAKVVWNAQRVNLWAFVYTCLCSCVHAYVHVYVHVYVRMVYVFKILYIIYTYLQYVFMCVCCVFVHVRTFCSFIYIGSSQVKEDCKPSERGFGTKSIFVHITAEPKQKTNLIRVPVNKPFWLASCIPFVYTVGAYKSRDV